MPRHFSALAALSLFGGLAVAADVYPISLPSVAGHGVQVVTAHDQVVYLPGCETATRTNTYSDKTVTTTVPAEGCPTGLGHVEGCGSKMTPGGPLVVVYRYAVNWVEVYEKSVSCQYSEVGPYAFPGYKGNECDGGCGDQSGYVKECSNGNCAAYQCYWGADGVQHCDDHSKPNGYVPAPAGCEVVTAHYPQCFDDHCFLAEAYYTVPIVIGFPPVYPPGVCHTGNCLLPPGWTTIITVLPGYTTTTTVTVPTTTVTTTTTATVTTGTTEPTAGALTCPAADRQVFVGDTGSTFLIECNVGVGGTEIDAREVERRAIAARALGTTGTFNGCIQLCDAIQTCEAVSYNPDTGVCRGFTDASLTTNPNGDYVATVIRRANPVSSTTTVSSTSTSTSSMAPGPSDDMDAAEVKRDELVPKRQAAKKAGSAGRVERRAGRIVSPNVEKEKKDKIRL